VGGFSRGKGSDCSPKRGKFCKGKDTPQLNHPKGKPRTKTSARGKKKKREDSGVHHGRRLSITRASIKKTQHPWEREAPREHTLPQQPLTHHNIEKNKKNHTPQRHTPTHKEGREKESISGDIEKGRRQTHRRREVEAKKEGRGPGSRGIG